MCEDCPLAGSETDHSSLAPTVRYWGRMSDETSLDTLGATIPKIELDLNGSKLPSLSGNLVALSAALQ